MNQALVSQTSLNVDPFLDDQNDQGRKRNEPILMDENEHRQNNDITVSSRQSFHRLFSFNLRGNSLNHILDISAPLLALVVRIASLRSHDQLEDMHKRILHELESIELELHRKGYDRVTIMAHRYCLCSAIDEAIMNSPWGQDSSWSERSLLAIFHNETWGGEKFFVILDRVLMEPNRYLDLIEFLYQCLCLGYEGRYRVNHNGHMQLEAIIKEVHSVIRKTRGTPEIVPFLYGQNITEKMHQIIWQTPITTVVGISAMIGLIVYLGYFFYLDNHIDTTLAELSKILGH